MTVSDRYLEKLRRAIRQDKDADTDAEIKELILECRQDLAKTGIQKVADETDPLILGAVRCYVRWKFGLMNPEAKIHEEQYLMLKDELSKTKEYVDVF